MGQIVDKEKAFKRLELLVKRFKNDLGNGDISGSHPLTVKDYPASEVGKKYSESQIRQGYILPMFRDVLGWDIDNSINEVIPELHNHNGFADFVFVRNNQRKFVLETKKPYVNIDPNFQSGRDGVRQSIGYARSLKDVSMALVSNFECLVFCHSYAMPQKGNEAKNVLEWFHFSEILNEEKFESLWQFRFEACSEKDFCPELLSKIDSKLVSKHKTIDQNLLDDLKEIRVLIADSISGVLLDSDKADVLTQHLINRIIFTRVLEDRGIINTRLIDLCDSENIWKDLRKRFDDIYFKFPIEVLNTKSKRLLDSQNLKIENESLSKAISMFYDRGSQFFHDCYDFKYIPSDILGYAYEHSIAFKLHLERNKFKLQRKKFYKNGVHYTPAYISKNLTSKTVERSLSRKQDKKIENLICIDIACGSGSFLTSLYDSLYRKKHSELDKLDELDSDGSKGVIPLKDRKVIVENCIYGIDIDSFAVEVSKLCIYLKFFEDFPAGKSKLNKSEIPNIEENIVCGDSLLDTTMRNRFPSQLRAISSNQKKVFKIIKGRKADVIVGNPPYIKIQDLMKIESFPVDLYKKYYEKSIGAGAVEFAIAFIERAMNILSPYGDLGFIIPNKIFKNKQGSGLRQLISESKDVRLCEFVDFNSVQIFDASIYTCLFHLTRNKDNSTFKCSQVHQMDDGAFLLSEIEKQETKFPSNEYEIDSLKCSDLNSEPWNLLVGIKRKIFGKIFNRFPQLKTVIPENKIFQGIPTGSDKIFILDKVSEKNSSTWVMTSEALLIKFKKDKGISRITDGMKIPTVEIEKKYLKPVFRGSSDLKHFWAQNSECYTLYPYNKSGELLEDNSFRKSKAYKYLNRPEHRMGIKDSRNKILLQGLEERENGKFQGSCFYQYSRPQNLDLWAGNKIMFPYLVEHFNAHLDSEHTFINVSTGGYAIIAPEKREKQLILLSILNSEVFNFLIKSMAGDFRGGWFECSNQYVGAIPVPDYMNDINIEIDINDIEDTIGTLYEKNQLARIAKSNSKKIDYLSEFNSNLDWLNTLVADMYELSESELSFIDFYSSGELDREAELEIEELHKLLNEVEQSTAIDIEELEKKVS